MRDVDFITDRIAIGNWREASDIDLLRDEGVTAVLNVAYNIDLMFPEARDENAYAVEYHKVGLIDGMGNHATTLLAAVLTLHQLLDRHERVIVHCQAGISRSVTVVTMYLAGLNDTSFHTTLADVKRKRHPALISHAIQLRDWRERLSGDSLIPTRPSTNA
ncbi:MAG: dual specificity protein phosphatase [Candidatus Poribacteria bacterium]|nr:dual specificity protein phosphatase [Candidatus Poribacteria bacterium]